MWDRLLVYKRSPHEIRKSKAIMNPSPCKALEGMGLGLSNLSSQQILTDAASCGSDEELLRSIGALLAGCRVTVFFSPWWPCIPASDLSNLNRPQPFRPKSLDNLPQTTSTIESESTETILPHASMVTCQPVLITDKLAETRGWIICSP